MKYYYKPTKMVKIEKNDKTKCWWECRANEAPLLVGSLENCSTVSNKIKYAYLIAQKFHF